MKKPKISVIIPIYNDEKYLEDCLNSVVKQTFTDFECICVDDCSTDRSSEIINNFIQKDTRIRCVKHDKNLGVSYSRYTGLLEAKADWIAFIDHDDVLTTKYLELLYKEIDEENKVDVICCRYASLTSKLDTYNHEKHYYSDGREALRNSVNNVNFCTYTLWARLLKRDILLKLDCNKYKEESPLCWFEDTFVMVLYYFVCNRVVVINDILYRYREHNDSLGHTPFNANYYVDHAASDYIIVKKFFEKKSYIEGRKRYEGMLLAYMRAAYFSLENDKNYEQRKTLVKEFRYRYNEYKNIHKDMNIYTRINTAVFNRFPLLWNKTIGYIYFDVSPKFPKINKYLSSLR